MKHHINDELFSDYKAYVVAKKSKPEHTAINSGSFCLSEGKSLSSHIKGFAAKSQEEFLKNLPKNFLKILAEGLQ